ncbi:MAG: 6-phosphofructokinase [Chloroflexi bacterium]|nr:6-phosphofructokinase [Chloroflexota bacterium]
MRRIAVLTSGGDAPGMNAAIRAVVRTATHHEIEVLGIRRGYLGLVRDAVEPLDSRSVSEIIHRGGTILGTARCEEFRTPEGRAMAQETLRRHGVDGLVAVGGDGTFRGGLLAGQEWSLPIVGVPGTIDNDVAGTDFTIGFDTAVNTALEAIDRIRDTAESLERLFFVEVMGRTRGFIALEVALAGGAKAVLLPEEHTDVPRLCARIRSGLARGWRAIIVVTAEGDDAGGAMRIAAATYRELAMEYRVAILGHVQRGGNPSARDRILASLLGAGAVEGLLAGQRGCMVGQVHDCLVYTPFAELLAQPKPLDTHALRLVDVLAG